ncbi:hypothetical protein E4634_08480 [Mangrovimicrobium sediminis]|uniref:Uncharacterized protein n=1 Tax=Mangrovimicrobium sediminis TaxID=2562682 RepID=A0A4Z0M459_9GAMM|nr:hypothetical protein [Haliea sp. SAOS-164]TGD74158.1 hypothetical protein E4634_08480 [Haliea sp. SAOS-164]
MASLRRKVGNYAWLMVSLLLVFGVGIALYVMETENRGSYFHQLRFRQLGETARGFETNLASFNTLAREHRQIVARELTGVLALRETLARIQEMQVQGAVATQAAGTQSHPGLARAQQAQTGLMLFYEGRCADGGTLKPQGWLAERLLERARLLNPDSQAAASPAPEPEPAAEDPNTVPEPKKTLKNQILNLETQMCAAGALASIPPGEMLAWGNAIAKAAGRIRADAEAIELEGYSGTAAATARDIREILSTSLQLLQAGLNGVSKNQTEKNIESLEHERLTQFVQEQIAKFWSGELSAFWRNPAQANQQVLQAAAAATPAEIRKSMDALNRLVQIVEQRYTAPDSPLSPSAKQHRLAVDFVQAPTISGVPICTREKDFLQSFVFPGGASGPYVSSHYAIGNCIVQSQLAYVASFSELLALEADQFALVMIADAKGRLLYSGSAEPGSDNQFNVNIRDLLGLSAEEAEQAGGEQGEPTNRSLIREIDYLGVPHLAYVLPHKLNTRHVQIQDDIASPEKNASTGEGETGTRNVLAQQRLESLYFVGLIPERQVKSDKLRLSPGFYSVLLAIAIAILLGFVFLKIKWIHIAAAFTRWDRRFATFAVVLMTLLIAIGSTTLLVYSSVRQDFKADAAHALHRIASRFEDEFNQVLYTADKLLTDPQLTARVLGTANTADNPACAADAPEDNRASPAGKSLCSTFMCEKKDTSGSLFGEVTSGWYLHNLEENRSALADCTGAVQQPDLHSLENILILDENGKVSGDLVRGSEKLVQLISRPDLSKRHYFQQAKSGDVLLWPVTRQVSSDEAPETNNAKATATEEHIADIPIAIERILSVSNGSLSTQVALPLEQLCTAVKPGNGTYFPGFNRLCDARSTADGASAPAASPRPLALSFGFSLEVARAPLLPSNLKFAVIDNASGTVLYHSQPRRSLVESFYEETEFDAALLAYTRANTARQRSVEEDDPPFFDGLYRGERTRFYLSPINSRLPWTLIVFHEKEYLGAYPALQFALSLMIGIGALVLICTLVLILGAKWKGITSCLWPRLEGVGFYWKWVRRLLVIAAVESCLLAIIFLSHGPDSYMATVARSFSLFVAGYLALFAMLAVLLHISFRKRFRCDLLPGGAQAKPGCYEGSQKLTRSYALYIWCLLLACVAIPAVGITNAIGVNLLHALADYDTLILDERSEESHKLGCDYHARRGEPCPGGNIPTLRCLDVDLMYAVFAEEGACSNIETGTKTPAEERILLRHESKRSTRQSAGPYDVNFELMLRLISPVWEHAGLLRTLAFDNPAETPEPDTPAQASTTVAADYTYPNFVQLLRAMYESWLGFGVVLATLFLAWLVYQAIRFLARYLLGTGVPVSYRTTPQVLCVDWDNFVEVCRNRSTGDVERLTTDIAAGKRARALCIRPMQRQMQVDCPVWSENCTLRNDVGTARPIDLSTLLCEPGTVDKLARNIARSSHPGPTLLMLENIESAAFDTERRKRLLEFLEQVVLAPRGPAVVIFCDVSPLYLLTNQKQYLANGEDDDKTSYDPAEILRWSKLLAKFSKYYGWAPCLMEIDQQMSVARQTLIKELRVWPQLLPLKDVFTAQIGKRIDSLSEEQVVQFVGAHAGAEYRRRWSLCTRAERLMLYQLANGLIINTRNIEPLEHLIRRGYIERNPHWAIANQSFARFVRSAESSSVFATWMEEADRGVWRLLKVPMLGFALVIIGIIIYSTQQELNSFVTLFSGVLGLIPLLLRNISLLSGNGSGGR